MENNSVRQEKRYFVLKLIPPRPTFAADISEEESKIMMEHGAYWRDLMHKGIAILFGPVFDPKGVWGLGVVQVDNEDQAYQLSAGDPAIRSGLHKGEVYPMDAVFRV